MNASARLLATLLSFFVLGAAVSAGFAANPPRMRPYAGIGLVVFSQPENTPNHGLQLPLYEEPGLSRVGILDSPKLPGNEWLFDLQDGTLPLVVSARKGDWLRVIYDDAGREAWIDPLDKGHFLSWEEFLKLQSSHMLPGLQPQYYTLMQRPGGKQLDTLTPKQTFRVLKLDASWGMVLTEQSQIGWIRWCDSDGRLTVGTGKK